MGDDAQSFTIGLVDQISGPARAASGSLSGLVGGLQKVAKGLDMLAPGMGSIVSALIGVDGAIAGVALSLAESGISLAASSASWLNDTRQSLQALLGSAEAADSAMGAIRDVGAASAATKEQIAGLAKGLADAGFQGDALKSALQTLTDVQVAVGDSAAQKLQRVVEKAAAGGAFKLSPRDLIGTGITEDQIASALGMDRKTFDGAMKQGKISAADGMKAIEATVANSQIGIVAKAKADTLSAAWSNFKDKTIPELFSGISFAPLIQPFKDLLGDFDDTTASGHVMHAALVGAIQGIVDAEATGIPIIKNAFEEVIIASLKVAIAVKPTYEAVKQFLSTHQDELITALKVCGVVALVLVAAIVILAAVGMVAAGVALLIAAALLGVIGAAGAAALACVSFAVDAVGALGKWASSAVSASADFVHGIVAGIAQGTGEVVAAIQAMAGSAVTAFKAKLGIASPSKVMFDATTHVTEGVVNSLTAGGPRVRAAMVATIPSVDGQAGAGARAGGGGRASMSITVAPGAVVIHLSGEVDMRELQNVTQSAVTQALEKFALQAGQ